MKLTKTKLAVLVALIGVTTSIFAGYGYQPMAENTAVGTDTQTLTQTVTNRLSKTEQSFSEAIEDYTASVDMAIKNAITQEAYGPTTISDADMKARQLKAGLQYEQEKAERIEKKLLDHGPVTGQGYNPCLVLEQGTSMAKSFDAAKKKASDSSKLTDNVGGRVATDIATVTEERKKLHAHFCTEGDKKMNNCEAVSSLPGADSDASMLFQSTEKGSLANKAQDVLRQNLLGSPTLAIPKSAAQTAAGQAYLYNTNRKAALNAFPAYSLAYIQTMSEIDPNLKDASGKAVSPRDMIFKTVTRYYGSEEAETWAASMVQQRPRGLLVELAKMEGVGAWMDYQEYLTNQRMEGNLAAMTVTATLPLEERMRKQRASLIENTAAISFGR